LKKLKQGEKVKRESLKTASSISSFLLDILESQRLMILELREYKRAKISNHEP